MIPEEARSVDGGEGSSFVEVDIVNARGRWAWLMD